MIDSGQPPRPVNDHLSLQSGGHRLEIPLLAFVAGWAAMCHDSLDDDIDDSADAAWRQQPLPLAAWTKGIDGPVVLESVEILCRILCDTMDWTLQDDPGFRQRNAGALIVDDADTARLHETAISTWEAADQPLRNTLLRTMDGRVFAVLVISGNALD